MRLGLCCQFKDLPIKFRTTTATALARLDREAALAKLDALCLHNAQTLIEAISACAELGIRAFRVGSGLWPLYTHPVAGYSIDSLASSDTVIAAMRRAGETARLAGIRLSFHPDQFTLLSTTNPTTLAASLRDLAYMAEMAELIGADVINIHGGGAYGDKESALACVRRNIDALPDAIRSRLTLENDDVTYTPRDLLPVCREVGVPFTYDVHHHRCLQDGLDVAYATEQSLATWNREPLFHISSPRDPAPAAQRPHADLIDPLDFPRLWTELDITVDVEAKAKEVAVLALGAALGTGIVR